MGLHITIVKHCGVLSEIKKTLTCLHVCHICVVNEVCSGVCVCVCVCVSLSLSVCLSVCALVGLSVCACWHLWHWRILRLMVQYAFFCHIVSQLPDKDPESKLKDTKNSISHLQSNINVSLKEQPGIFFFFNPREHTFIRQIHSKRYHQNFRTQFEILLKIKSC